MNKEQILALMVDDVAARAAMIGTFVADKTNSFEDRKEVFLATPEHLYTKDQWILHLSDFEKKYGEISWFDDFYAERHSDVDLVSIINDAEIDPNYGFFTSQEKLDDFTRAVVEHGKHAFNLDW